MASVDTLPDLPVAWLHRLSTTLTAESAARLRSTCKLLREVVDATWEPDDQPVPPHRRSVPLTFEQVKAQLPPAQPRPEAFTWWCYEEKYERPEKHGCNPFWLEVFGPALTRLTAKQAVNLLKGKTVLCALWCAVSDIDEHSSDDTRLGVLSELVFDDPCVQWPPQKYIIDEPQGNPIDKGHNSGMHESGSLAGSAECKRHTQAECASDDASRQPLLPGRGAYGWSVIAFSEGVFAVECSKPAALLQKWGLQRAPYRVAVTTKGSRLLVTTDSSCRRATYQEVQQFRACDSPDDGDRFDVYLKTDGLSGPMPIYAFLGPLEPRLTGRPKEGALRLKAGCCWAAAATAAAARLAQASLV